MNDKTKKWAYRILKIVWALIGVFISVFTISVYLKMNSPIGLGIIAWVILFTIGLYSFFFYIGITILFLFLKWLIKKIRQKNKEKKLGEYKNFSSRAGGRDK